MSTVQVSQEFGFTPFGQSVWWDACSWKGQLERTRSWKVLSWKVWSWKESSEVGKNRAKLGRTQRSLKEQSEVGKILLKLESFAEVGKFKFNGSFPTSLSLSKFNFKFPTSIGSFQLRSVLTNFSESFQIQTFQLKTSRSFQLPFSTTRIPFQIFLPRYNVFYRVPLFTVCWTWIKLIVCVHIWLVGLAICFFRQTYELHPLPMLGGLLWATGNLCQGLKASKTCFCAYFSTKSDPFAAKFLEKSFSNLK